MFTAPAATQPPEAALTRRATAPTKCRVSNRYSVAFWRDASAPANADVIQILKSRRARNQRVQFARYAQRMTPNVIHSAGRDADPAAHHGYLLYRRFSAAHDLKQVNPKAMIP